MTIDEQEALSNQHADGWWCVPLASGRIAVFEHPHDHALYTICDNWSQVIALPRRPVQPIVRHVPKNYLDLGEISL